MVPSSSRCYKFIHPFHVKRFSWLSWDLAMRENEKFAGQSGTMTEPVICLCPAHAAAVVQDARILSALVTRDASGTILSRSSRSSLGTSPALSFIFFSFSFPLPSPFFFLVDALHDVTSERDFQICWRVSRDSRDIRVFRISREREFLDRWRHRFSKTKQKNFTRSEWRD